MKMNDTMAVAEAEELNTNSPTHEPSSDEEEEEMNSFGSMQTELHNKGAVLTRAWSDLFSFITKYQAELVVKENSVEIAEKEIEQRKRQLEEMKPVVDAGNEEVSKLQNEIHTKERLLSNAQSQLSVKERMLQRMQVDLSSNMGQLEKCRSELLGKQNDLVRFRGEIARLKSDLTVKQEQILIKDNLLKKLQNQLMKENAELKEQLELERRAHELEKRSHELTKRSMASSLSSESRKRHRASETAVIEIPDSPPTLDLSSEQGDYGLSDIISLAESQSQARELDIPARKRFASGADSSISTSMTSTSQSFSEMSARLQHVPPATPPRWGYSNSPKVSPSPSRSMLSPSVTPPTTPMGSISEIVPISEANISVTASDTFFPLSVSDDVKPSVDNSSVQIDSDIQTNMTIIKPGTPSSGTSDSNQGPVPVCGPIPSSAMFAGGTDVGADGKLVIRSRRGTIGTRVAGHSIRVRSPVRHKCLVCGRVFQQSCTLNRHMHIHNVDKPYKCPKCNKTFIHRFRRHEHIVSQHGGDGLDLIADENFRCEICGRGFTQNYYLEKHQSLHVAELNQQTLG